MRKWLLAIMVLAAPAVYAGDLGLDIGIGVRATSDLGYEQKVDPSAYASLLFDRGDLAVHADVEYVKTRKFFLPPDADDHAVLASWRVGYEPSSQGVSLGFGGRHSSLYTASWDKVRTGGEVALGWRFGGPYSARVDVLGHLPDEDDVQGVSVLYSIDDGSRWASGYQIQASVVQHESRGVEYEGYIIGIRFSVASK